MSLTPGTIAHTALFSLWQRLKLGEGGLLGMVAWLVAWESRDIVVTVLVTGLLALLLTSLYLFNDVCDRIVDAHNPKKTAAHRRPLLEQPRTFALLAVGLHLGVAGAAWYALGSWAAGSTLLLLLLNPLYSLWVKRIPVLDVFTVGVMGGALVGLGTDALDLLLLAATMTAISHAFQTRVDERADRAVGIASSAVAAHRNWIWLALAVAYGCTVFVRLGALAAASAALPFLLLRLAHDANPAWMLARVYFGAVWILATVR